MGKHIKPNAKASKMVAIISMQYFAKHVLKTLQNSKKKKNAIRQPNDLNAILEYHKRLYSRWQSVELLFLILYFRHFVYNLSLFHFLLIIPSAATRRIKNTKTQSCSHPDWRWWPFVLIFNVYLLAYVFSFPYIISEFVFPRINFPNQ